MILITLGTLETVPYDTWFSNVTNWVANTRTTLNSGEREIQRAVIQTSLNVVRDYNQKDVT